MNKKEINELIDTFRNYIALTLEADFSKEPNLSVIEEQAKKTRKKLYKIIRRHTKEKCQCEECQENRGDWIDDGHGNQWSAWCPECHQKSIVVVRPGKVQCINCG